MGVNFTFSYEILIFEKYLADNNIATPDEIDAVSFFFALILLVTIVLTVTIALTVTFIAETVYMYLRSSSSRSALRTTTLPPPTELTR